MEPKEERLVPLGAVAARTGASVAHVRAWAGDAVQEKIDGLFITESLAELIVQTQIEDARRRDREHDESVSATHRHNVQIEQRVEEIAGELIASIKNDPRAYDYSITEPNGEQHGRLGLNRMAQRMISEARRVAREQAVAEAEGREPKKADSEVLTFAHRLGFK